MYYEVGVLLDYMSLIVLYSRLTSGSKMLDTLHIQHEAQSHSNSTARDQKSVILYLI